MISWYIKYNTKFYLISMTSLFLIGIIMLLMYISSYTLFAIYAFTMMMIITYVDTITQIRRYLESNHAKEWYVAQWHLKDCVTYSLFVLIMLILGTIVIHLSPPNIPGNQMHYATACMFVIMAIIKWLRYIEYKNTMKAGNIK
ncbi:hypothetical protein ROU88_07860 [Macrococcus capreoli]